MTSKGEDNSPSVAGRSRDEEAGSNNGIHGRTTNQLPSASYSSVASASTARPNDSLSAPPSLAVSAAASTVTSPQSSRNTSPIRPPQRQQSSAGAVGGLRSRSPSRPPSIPNLSTSIPSAAAIQRALSAATTPQLQPTSVPDTSSKIPRPQKSGAGTPGEITSPRLKSPPPPPASHSRPSSLPPKTNAESNLSAPNVGVQRSTPASSTPPIPSKGDDVDNGTEEHASSNMKGTVRGVSGVAPALETVQEASLPNTPGFGMIDAQRYTYGSTPPFVVSRVCSATACLLNLLTCFVNLLTCFDWLLAHVVGTR